MGNKTMKAMLLASVALVGIAASGSASAWTGFADNPLGPEFIITFALGGGITTALNPAYSVDPGPYDGADDTYFGVINNSSNAISSFNLSSSTQDIGGFDSDGIDEANYLNIPHNAMDPSGYGGPNGFFTNNLGTSLTVNFITPIASGGGSDIFSLEEPVSLTNIVVGGVPEPSTWAMMLLGFAGLGVAAYRKTRTKAAALLT